MAAYGQSRSKAELCQKTASNKDPRSLSGRGIPRLDSGFFFFFFCAWEIRQFPRRASRHGCIPLKELTDATVRMLPKSETGRTGYLILRPRKLRVLALRPRIVRPHKFTRQVTTIKHPQDEKMESITTDSYEWPSMFEQIDYDDRSYTGS